MRRFTRGEILERLNRTIKEGKPIIVSGAGCGLVAKCVELGGVDLILVVSMGKYRMMGLPSAAYIAGDSNAVTLELGKEVMLVVKNTPVIAGIMAADLTRRTESLLQECIDIGFSGVMNCPTVWCDRGCRWRIQREDVNLGFNREVEMMKLAREMDTARKFKFLLKRQLR